MSTKPVLTFSQVAPLIVQHYERYIPTAHDESLTILEKIHKIIIHLNQIGELANSVSEKWNEVMEWILKDGLTEAITDKLDEMVLDGTLDEIINEHIFNELNTKIDGLTDDLTEFKEDINADFDSFKEDTTSELNSRTSDVTGLFGLSDHPLAKNPVLTGADVTDMNAKGVADPFIVFEDDMYHMFFEVMDATSGKGSIGHATSRNGVNWRYDRLILSASNHFAYPYVFKHNGEYYMLPDTGGDINSLNLYKATNFPYDWQIVRTLVYGTSPIDPILFQFKNVWYLMYYNHGSQQTNLFYTNDDTFLTSNWLPHPNNPIAQGWHYRPGGRPIVSKSSVDIFIQKPNKDQSIYGHHVDVVRLTNLSKTSLIKNEAPKPIITAQGTDRWHNAGMHNVDIVETNRGTKPIAVVDGVTTGNVYSIGIYSDGDNSMTPYMRAILNTEIDAPSSTWTRIPYNLFLPDNVKGYDSVSHEYVVPEDGIYYVSNSTTTQITNTTNDKFVLNQRILRNGVEYRTSPDVGQSNSFNIPKAYEVSDVLLLNEGDRLAVEFTHNAGVPLPILTQGWSTWFSVVKLK